MTSRVGERGQITIEKAIREQLAIYAGDEAVQRVEDGRIVIEIVPGRHARSLAGVLREHVGRWPEDESWEVLRAAAWDSPDPAWDLAVTSTAVRRSDRHRHLGAGPVRRRVATGPGPGRQRADRGG